MSTKTQPCTDHLGNTFPSINKMCKHWNIDATTYNNRITRGLSQKQALTQPTTPKTHTDHLGNTFSNLDDLCKHYNIKKSVYKSRLKIGWSKEKALTTPLQNTTCTDHLGNIFSSQKEMCQYWNITWREYKRRIALQWSLEKTLTTKSTKRQKQKIKDYLGNKFPTEKAMCDHWNIPYDTYKSRRKSQWSLEKNSHHTITKYNMY